MRLVRTLLSVAVVLGLAGTLLAAEGPKRGEGRRGGGPGRLEFLLKAVESLDLTADQKAKVAEIKTEAAELTKKQEAVLPQEQKDAREKAMEEAKKAGKTGFDVFRAGMDAVKLTDEQKTKRDELRKDGEKIREKVMGLLTDEQKTALRAKMPRRGEKQKPDSK